MSREFRIVTPEASNYVVQANSLDRAAETYLDIRGIKGKLYKLGTEHGSNMKIVDEDKGEESYYHLKIDREL